MCHRMACFGHVDCPLPAPVKVCAGPCACRDHEQDLRKCTVGECGRRVYPAAVACQEGISYGQRPARQHRRRHGYPAGCGQGRGKTVGCCGDRCPLALRRGGDGGRLIAAFDSPFLHKSNLQLFPESAVADIAGVERAPVPQATVAGGNGVLHRLRHARGERFPTKWRPRWGILVGSDGQDGHGPKGQR